MKAQRFHPVRLPRFELEQETWAVADREQPDATPRGNFATRKHAQEFASSLSRTDLTKKALAKKAGN